MEVAGLVLGIGGLAGTFDACMSVVGHVEDFLNADREQRHTYARWQVITLRLRNWGQAVGLSGQEQEEAYDPRLDDPKTYRTILRVLSCIGEVWEPTERKFAKIPIEFGSEQSFSEFSGDRKSSLVEAHQQQPSRFVRDRKPSLAEKQNRISKPQSTLSRFNWALWKKDRMEGTVDKVGVLVEDLHTLVPTDQKATSKLIRRATGFKQSDRRLPQAAPNPDRADLFDRIEEHVISLDNAGRQKELQEWLGAPKVESPYHQHVDTRVEGTCKWILNTEAYQAWTSPLALAGSAKILWIHGPAGFGKTILHANIISHLEGSNVSRIAKFFASPKQPQNDLDTIVRSWVEQCVVNNPTALQSVLGLADENNMIGLASSREVWKALERVAGIDENQIFSLDGLDEFVNDDDQRRNFLRKLKITFALGKNRVLITSRDYTDIRRELTGDNQLITFYEHKITPDDVRPDNRLVAQDIVKQKLSSKKVSTQEDIAERMVQKCDGMFLWIKLQKGQLRETKGNSDLRRIVAKLPTGLWPAYERNLTAIRYKSKDERERAREILAWTMFAFMPINLFRLREALDVDKSENTSGDETQQGLDDADSDEEVEINSTWVENEVLDVCGSLLETQPPETVFGENAASDLPGFQIIRLVHSSVRDFLLSIGGASTEESESNGLFYDESAAHGYLAKKCLKYLNNRKVWEERDSASPDSPDNGLRVYAVLFWPQHFKLASEGDQSLCELVQDFLRSSNENFARWANFLELDVETRSSETTMLWKTTTTPLYFAAMVGVLHKIQPSKAQWLPTLNSIGGIYGTALQAACAKGNYDDFRILMDWGADVDLPGGHYGSAINAAAANGDDRVVLELIAAGANLGLLSDWAWTPLHWACNHGHVKAAEHLLANKADVNVVDQNGWTPLGIASSRGYHEIVKSLVHNGSNISHQGCDGCTALYCASGHGYIDIVKYLVQQGPATITSTANDNGWTPLHIASQCGNIEVVKHLIQHGANTLISMLTDEGWTPLHVASSYGRLEIVEFLLNYGADTALKSNLGWTSLNVASWYGHFDTVRSLVEAGADLSIPNDEGWTAVNSASEKGHTNIVRFLKQNQADISFPTNDGQTPLFTSAKFGHLETVKYLVENGAKVAESLEPGVTPLYVASENGHLEIVKCLKKNGGDVLSSTKDGWTPLLIACSNSHFETVKYLMENGTDIRAATDDGWTPLSLASDNGDLAMVQLLLRQDPNTPALSSRMRDPVCAAASGGYLEVVLALLETPTADVNVSEPTGRTPLSYAAGAADVSTLNHLLGLDQLRVDVEDNESRSPLSWAAQNGPAEAVRSLLDHAKVHATRVDVFGRPPLVWAAIGGKEENIQKISEFMRENQSEHTSADFLRRFGRDRIGCSMIHFLSMGACYNLLKECIENCSNIDDTDNQGWTALHWCAYFGHSNIVSLLVEHGADVNASDCNRWTPYHLSLYREAQDVANILKPGTNEIDDNISKPDIPPVFDGVTEVPIQEADKIPFYPSTDVLCSSCYMGHLRHVYHCKVCAEFDLCLRCAQDIKEIHAHHEFVGYHLPSKL